GSGKDFPGLHMRIGKEETASVIICREPVRYGQAASDGPQGKIRHDGEDGRLSGSRSQVHDRYPELALRVDGGVIEALAPDLPGDGEMELSFFREEGEDAALHADKGTVRSGEHHKTGDF